MWAITIRLIILFLVVMGISQVIIPLIMDTRLFWLFRKKKIVEPDKKRSFDEEVEHLGKKKEEVNKMKDEVEGDIDDKFEKVKNLKDNQ